MTKHSGSDNKSREASIRPVSKAAEQLDRTSGELLKAMDEQMEAIKSSDVDRMNRLTETYLAVIARFKQDEDRLTDELRKLIDPAVSLRDLKQKFPESEALIDHWREMLSEGGKKLMRKHNQLVSLLEFAVKQNGRLMEAVYQAGNRNNSRYGPDGESSAVNPGSAINHKI